MAHVDYFLKIDGIDGESIDKQFPKNIQLESWSYGETQLGSSSHGTGAGVGKVSLNDFHFVMQVNRASATLSQVCCSGKHLKFAELNCRKAGDTPQVFLKIKLSDVLVSSFQSGSTGSGEIIPTDKISLNYSRIDYAYGQQDAKGKVGALDQKMGYDQKTNTVV